MYFDHSMINWYCRWNTAYLARFLDCSRWAMLNFLAMFPINGVDLASTGLEIQLVAFLRSFCCQPLFWPSYWWSWPLKHRKWWRGWKIGLFWEVEVVRAPISAWGIPGGRQVNLNFSKSTQPTEKPSTDSKYAWNLWSSDEFTIIIAL